MESIIKNGRIFTRIIGIAAVMLCAALFPQDAAAQCAISYSDTSVNDHYVYAEAAVGDYYGSEQCGDFGGYFYHGYYLFVSISCGSQYEDVEDSTAQWGGGGYLYNYVSVTATESTVCDINIVLVIWCSALNAPILEVYQAEQAPIVSVKANGANCPISLTRGGTIGLVLDAPSPTEINWSFDGGGGTATKAGGTTWDGEMAESGTGTVTFRVPNYGPLLTRTCDITVNPRNAWALTAVTPTDRTNANNTYATACQDTTVSTGTPFGKACLGLSYGYTSTTVAAGGPNAGFKYVTSVNQSNSKFDWLMLWDLTNTQSAFYQAQCGNWNGSTGFISGANLQTNTIRHESGSVASHWDNYRDSQDSSSNNWGTAAEEATAAPTVSLAAFDDFLSNTLASLKAQSIGIATAQEPCGSHDTGYNGTCQYQGPVNVPPYASCNP